MDGRARYLLTPDFAYSETNPNLPPVVGRTVRWPLPRPQNYVYPSDNTETLPVPSPSPTSVIQSNGRVMAEAPSVRQRVPSRIAPTIIQVPTEQLTAHPNGKPKPSAPIGVRLPGPCTGAADIASTNISRR
ncbi:hypothetical protein DAPPUDRAFT_118317 [Daphnia pulex]|uniref:Uncharacterized protein n=1 Tax=Daphnia pulex TaxID=6669 RepID=E9HVE1_DAPPU|nr:hypothetical protein DAPPUDRAFT_118317 [Daphnia pulex]|eukprot:EFX64293.1 hypothetical protein DAPPUDRAFT_118317 [Daphnia pulex]